MTKDNSRCKYSWQPNPYITFYEDDEKGLLICLARNNLSSSEYKQTAEKIASYFPHDPNFLPQNNQIAFFDFLETPDMASYRECMDSFVILIDGCPKYVKGELLSLQGHSRIVLKTPFDEVKVDYHERGRHGVRRILFFLLIILCGGIFIWIKNDQKFGGEIKKNVAVSSVSLSKSSLTLIIGCNEVLRADIYPSNATDKRVSWTSSNPSVVTVSNGIVKAIAGGSAKITAKANGREATCSVVVNPILASIVSLDRNEVSLEVGASIKLNASVNPSNATDQNLLWSSSNSSIAKVDNGVITAVSSGKATIVAKVDNKTAECIITVTASQNSGTSIQVERSVDTYSQSCNIYVNEPSSTSDELFNKHKQQGLVFYKQYVLDETQIKIKNQALKEFEAANKIKKDSEVTSMIKWLKSN